MTGGKRITEEELHKVATEQMDDFIDMGCFRYPDQVRAPLIEGFELGFKYARSLLRDQAPEVCVCGHPHGGRRANAWDCVDCGKRIKEGT